MLKKIFLGLIAVFLLTISLSNPVETFASSNLSYEDVIKELENIKNNVNGDMDIAEKENVREKSYQLVNDLLDSTNDLSADEANYLSIVLGDIDAEMYDLEKEKGNVDFGSKSINFSKSDEEQQSSDDSNKMQLFAVPGGGTDWSGKGDILVSFKAKTGVFPHGHAAILSTNPHYVIEAIQSGVVHQSATKYWSTVNDEGQYYVKGASNSAYITAVNYAKKQIGEPYKLKTTLGNTNEWYCSKLVYQAWKSAGYSIGMTNSALGVAITPTSLSLDIKTVKYKSNPY